MNPCSQSVGDSITLAASVYASGMDMITEYIPVIQFTISIYTTYSTFNTATICTMLVVGSAWQIGVSTLWE